MGGLKVDQAKRLKQPEKDNTRLKKLLAEKEFDLSTLQEVAEGTFEPGPGAVKRWSRCGASWAFPSAGRAGC